MTNQEQARYCNGGEAAHWLVHEERYERMLAAFTGHLLAAIGRAGRLVLACRRNRAGSEWIAVPGAAAQHVPEPPRGDPTATGPLPLGERDGIAVLRVAALSGVVIEPAAGPLWTGRGPWR